MKYNTVVSITIMAVAAFIFTEFLVGHFQINGAGHRFILRLGFQIQFYFLIFVFYEYRELIKKTEILENRLNKFQRYHYRKHKIIKRSKREDNTNGRNSAG